MGSIEGTIEGVISALLTSADTKNKEMYQAILEGSEIKQFNNWEEFYFAVLYPFEGFIEAYIKTNIAEDNNAVFLISKSQFIERHFQKLIIKKEGSACCADKSRTIITRLINYYASGDEIYFNYDAEYTYHLPKKIFTTHSEIIRFYDAVKRLYYGDSDKYIIALAEMMGKP